MFKTLVYALVLLSVCLSLISGARAGSKPVGTGPVAITSMDLGSGR
ncbi:MAG: hypothetical protein KDK28_22020 [Maritimibacter sp.]|nr:hypothetical protein [Maritimibacter sp.]